MPRVTQLARGNVRIGTWFFKVAKLPVVIELEVLFRVIWGAFLKFVPSSLPARLLTEKH